MAGNQDHQGVVAYTAPFVFRNKFFDAKNHKFLVLLDGIQDVRNLGAIIRSSYCTNADGIIIADRRGAPINAAALKASSGLAEHCQIYLAKSVNEAVNELKSAGYNIYLAVFDGQNATTVQYQDPLCIVIGNEGTGIAKNIATAGTKITLPQKNGDISYNASVAAGILLFLVANQIGKIE